MSYTETKAYKCTCERCAHSWVAIKIPLTCSKCRSPYWDVARGNQKPVAAVSASKESDLADLRSLITTVKEKPKSDYYTKSIIPPYTPNTQPNWEEPTYKYD